MSRIFTHTVDVATGDVTRDPESLPKPLPPPEVYAGGRRFVVRITAELLALETLEQAIPLLGGDDQSLSVSGGVVRIELVREAESMSGAIKSVWHDLRTKTDVCKWWRLATEGCRVAPQV